VKFKLYVLFIILIIAALNNCIAQATSSDNLIGPSYLLLHSRAENTEAYCLDGKDNDKDRYIDCEDFGCIGTDACGEHSELGCSDGLDNDKDSYIDCEDFGCIGTDACGEHSELGCSDGLDNDKDSYIDCEDFGCSGTDACPIGP
jgi:hypothetical protein